MRLAFIHGINNEKNTSDSIEQIWWETLVRGFEENRLSQKTRPAIKVGYYADMLADAVAGRPVNATAMGGGRKSRSAALDFLREYQSACGITNEELAGALAERGIASDAVEQGPMLAALISVAAAIESKLPLRGKLIAEHFLVQATHYIEDEGLAGKIAVTVRKAIFDGPPEPTLVISHSLGTVVAYRLLAEDRASQYSVPLFVTLGSPLGIGMMRRLLPPKRQMPKPPIGKWINALRRDDVVTLGRELTADTIGFNNIENLVNGLVEESDKHSIEAYLRSYPVCSRIHAMLPS